MKNRMKMKMCACMRGSDYCRLQHRDNCANKKVRKIRVEVMAYTNVLSNSGA